jgi:hypothetical protein
MSTPIKAVDVISGVSFSKHFSFARALQHCVHRKPEDIICNNDDADKVEYPLLISLMRAESVVAEW